VTEKPSGLEENEIILYREGPEGSFNRNDIKKGFPGAINLYDN